jgi:hypothetical protein
MFSDTFFKADKYNLNTCEYISTFERMPWRYTSLTDPQYLPKLDSKVSSKLNKLFQYRYPHTVEILSDHNKLVNIEYVDEEIKSFFLHNPMKYATVSSIPSVWKTFASFAGIDCLCDCKEKIDRMTDVTDIIETDIMGIYYDKDANFSGLRLYDPTYNLDEYSSNEILLSMNNFCKKQKNARGYINIFHDSDILSFILSINIPQVTLTPEERGNLKPVCEVAERREISLNKLLEMGYISQEQKEFIESKCVGRTDYDIEYFISESGEIVDMVLRHYTVLNFEDLTEG